MRYNTIISPETLKELLQAPAEDLVILDASGTSKDYELFLKHHIESAVFVPGSFLSQPGIDPVSGGRHPLPIIEEFCNSLGQLGISKSSTVVIYDNKNGANQASRLWWMLQSIGHSQTFVLDGGFQQALSQGVPMESGQGKVNKVKPYKAIAFNWPTIDLDQVVENQSKATHLLIDVREQQRYDGIIEPIDLLAGHIPGAINIAFEKNLQPNGRFLSKEQLYNTYSRVLENFDMQNVAVHCGSGVTACHTILSLVHAGFDLPALYVGSWSQYSRSDYPKITKDS